MHMRADVTHIEDEGVVRYAHSALTILTPRFVRLLHASVGQQQGKLCWLFAYVTGGRIKRSSTFLISSI
jgi:hypothetical protein